jgi:hypothetical protein
MKNLLLNLTLFFIISTSLFAQNSLPSTILDWRIGDKIDTTGYSKTLTLPYIVYAKDKFNNIDTWTQKTFYSEISPSIKLTQDSILTSISFKFNVNGYNKTELLNAFYDKLKVVDGYMFWNHDTADRYWKNNRDGVLIDIRINGTYVEVSKTTVADQ